MHLPHTFCRVARPLLRFRRRPTTHAAAKNRRVTSGTASPAEGDGKGACRPDVERLCSDTELRPAGTGRT
jgi:hypothetical protein